MAEVAEPFKESIPEYLMGRIATALNVRSKAAIDKFKKSFEKEENSLVFNNFLKDEGSCNMFFALLGTSDSVDLYFEQIPQINKLKRKGVVIMKLFYEPITKMNVQREVTFIELTRNIFDNIYGVFNEIMGPAMQNPENQAGWTDLVSKDLMEKFNNYVAQVYVIMGLTRGKTMLPLPSKKLIQSETTPNKDKAHVYESSIITWTKQIKNVLKLEPEQALKAGNNPGPLTELDFWKHKAENLDSIFAQLNSPEVVHIMQFLEGNKSTYTKPFAKLQTEVCQQRIEANNNSLFLQTLRENFQKLCEPGGEFVTIVELFDPVMYTILRIWKSSKFYNTPPILVVLIREICNAIITKAQVFVDGPQIFTFI